MHQYEKAVLEALAKGASTPSELSQSSKLPVDSVVKAAYWLKEKNGVEIIEESRTDYSLSEEGERFLGEGFPEQNVLEKAGKEASCSKLSREELSIGIPWAKRKGWIEFSEKHGEKCLKLSEAGKKAVGKEYPEQTALEKVKEGKAAEVKTELLEELAKRGNVSKKESRSLTIKLTEEGKKLLKEAGEGESEVNVLTPEMIRTGEWSKLKLRAYDVKTPGEPVYAGKTHPLQALIGRISEIFLEMGFTEMDGPEIESSFWNFDALFQPQDHPARELADTFYLEKPSKFELPSAELVKKVRKAHKKGWKYNWSAKKAEQPVLRTHTTAVSGRFLAKTGSGELKAPAKYFSIGRVYRNEAIDFKHLAEFHQVEGIVVWENASFTDLLGCLKEFYRKLGFEKIRFRPSYFPYTEPSLEVEVWFEPKKAWLEFGGAGIFRPEVSLPLWGKYPVLAWGLSLERPLMMLMGLDDIRTFYKNNLGFLRNTRITGKKG